MEYVEPKTSGKVIIRTTFGDFETDLWCKETPKTCRNFIQLALEGYYDGTQLFKLIPGLLIQGGDRNNDGSGGTTIYKDNQSIETEIHPRLKFNRKGLLGCVS